MEDKDKVVIPNIALDYYRHPDKAMIAARSSQLGLTAYGETIPEARCEWKHLFATFIDVLRDRGLLDIDKRLANVNWYWADEYEGKMEEADDQFSKNNWITKLLIENDLVPREPFWIHEEDSKELLTVVA